MLQLPFQRRIRIQDRIEVEIRTGDNIPLFMGCEAFRFKIILAYGCKYMVGIHGLAFSRSLYAYETDLYINFEPLFKDQGGSNWVFRYFRQAKVNPILVEENGNLYVLIGAPLNEQEELSFEVFNPKTMAWSDLDSPELFSPHFNGNIDPFLFWINKLTPFFSHAISSSNKKIFISKIDTVLFCFDFNTHEWEKYNLLVEWPDEDRAIPVLDNSVPLPFFGKVEVLEVSPFETTFGAEYKWYFFNCRMS